MKAIRATHYGNTDELVLQELPALIPGPDEVLIEVAGSGINPVDGKVLSGAMSAFIPLELPYTPGVEIAGRVVATGEAVQAFKPGDEVFGFIGITGGYATQALATADRLAHRPLRLSALQASGVPAAALTAWQALHEQAKIKPGQTLLIHGAAGGVGSMAVQMARLAGVKVIATASARNESYLKTLGAEQVIDYARMPFEKLHKAVDAVLDLVGGETQTRSWPLIKSGGVLVSTVSPPDETMAKVAGVTGRHFATRSDGDQLAQIAALFDSGELSIDVDVVPLSQAGIALKKVMEGHTRGKRVLDARL